MESGERITSGDLAQGSEDRSPCTTDMSVGDTRAIIVAELGKAGSVRIEVSCGLGAKGSGRGIAGEHCEALWQTCLAISFASEVGRPVGGKEGSRETG